MSKHWTTVGFFGLAVAGSVMLGTACRNRGSDVSAAKADEGGSTTSIAMPQPIALTCGDYSIYLNPPQGAFGGYYMSVSQRGQQRGEYFSGVAAMARSGNRQAFSLSVNALGTGTVTVTSDFQGSFGLQGEEGGATTSIAMPRGGQLQIKRAAGGADVNVGCQTEQRQ